jgi:DNA-binding NarL/FixJ family response regulator
MLTTHEVAEALLSGRLKLVREHEHDPRRQVVSRVLHGDTNLAIAEARRTSLRTVANQLAAIYRKLGVSSRWELAAEVSRHAGRARQNDQRVATSN